MSSPLRNVPLAPALALAALLAGGCSESGREGLDREQLYVDHGDGSLELTQRFDARGELVETTLVQRTGADARAIRARGPLLTAEGATEGGARVRRFLTTVDPVVLARLHRAGLRWDLAVLTADAMLELAPEAQRAAARALADGDGEPELCALLGACADAPDGPPPQT